MTLSRLMALWDADAAHLITTRHGAMTVLPVRGPHLAAAAIGFDEEEPGNIDVDRRLPIG